MLVGALVDHLYASPPQYMQLIFINVLAIAILIIGCFCDTYRGSFTFDRRSPDRNHDHQYSGYGRHTNFGV